MDGVAVNPVGVGSFICMLVAVCGPLLVAVIVKVPVLPTFIGVVPVLVMVMLAILFMVIVLSVIVVVVGYSFHVAVAWLVMVVPASAVVIILVNVSVAIPPFVRLFIVHIPLL